MSDIQTFMNGFFNLVTIWWNCFSDPSMPLIIRMVYFAPFFLMIVGLISLVVGNNQVSGGKSDL